MHSLSLTGGSLPAARIRWLELPGDPERPIRVFLHGLGCVAAFDHLEAAVHPALAGPRTLVVDLLGFGFSDRPADFGYTMAEHADTVAAVLDHLGVGGAEVVGHSMGGTVAITLAERRGGLVGRLVLSEPNLDPGGGLSAATLGEEEYVRSGFAARVAAEAPEYAARLRLADPVAVHRSATALFRGTDPTWGAVLAGLRCPRAYMIGGLNRPAEEERQITAAGIPIVEVPGAGHDMMTDNPDGYAEAVAAALRVAR